MKKKYILTVSAVAAALTVVLIYHGSGLADIKIISGVISAVHFRHFAGFVVKLFQKIF